jgi:endonuclease/exonuclease/phosphatase (EEP) superfamily protein YafD
MGLHFFYNQLLRSRGIKWLLILSAAAYIPGLLLYVFHPGHWWILGLYSIAFPWLWLGFGLLLFLARYQGKALRGFMLLLWLLGLIYMQNILALVPPSQWNSQPSPRALRLVQWNCQHLAGIENTGPSNKAERLAMVQLLKRENPDVLLLEDFADYQGEYIRSNLALLRDSLGYSHVAFKPYFEHSEPWGDADEGVALFSKIPLLRVGHIPFTGRNFPNYITWADLFWNGKPVRLAVTHFSSMSLKVENIPVKDMNPSQLQDSVVLSRGNYFSRLKHFQPFHVAQAKALRLFIDTSSVPVIVGADLNSVPSSYAYRKARGSLKDAHLQKGWGMGQTYHTRLPSVRIDYLFYHPSIHLMQLSRHDVSLSDHYLLMADFEWKER